MIEKKISICLTTFNRPEYTMESFRMVLNDERISEIIIVDDCSSKNNYNKLVQNILSLKNPKIKLYRNQVNKGVYDNKREVIIKATNDYVIQFDSDNTLDKSFIDAIYSLEWREDVIFAPVYAKPAFDYRPFKNVYLTKDTIKPYLDRPLFNTFLNTMNFFVNRKRYIKSWTEKPGIIGADSIYMNYLWLKNGGKIIPVEGMEYEHRMHKDSHYINNEALSTPLCGWVLNEMKKL